MEIRRWNTGRHKSIYFLWWRFKDCRLFDRHFIWSQWEPVCPNSPIENAWGSTIQHESEYLNRSVIPILAFKERYFALLTSPSEIIGPGLSSYNLWWNQIQKAIYTNGEVPDARAFVWDARYIQTARTYADKARILISKEYLDSFKCGFGLFKVTASNGLRLVRIPVL